MTRRSPGGSRIWPDGAKPRVLLEVLIALGRLRWSGAPRWLAQTWKGGDPAQAHAALRLLRDSENWPDVLTLLDRPGRPRPASPDLRTVALRALGDRANPTIVAGIDDRLKGDSDPRRRRQYVNLLARVYKRPEPWVYWGFRPAPRPANTVAWERTASIAEALNRTLADSDTVVRRSALLRMRREQVPVRLDALADWLRTERDAGHVAAILDALEGYPVDQTQRLLIETIASGSARSRQSGRRVAIVRTGIDSRHRRSTGRAGKRYRRRSRAGSCARNDWQSAARCREAVAA